jgi:hypothetical protein
MSRGSLRYASTKVIDTAEFKHHIKLRLFVLSQHHGQSINIMLLRLTMCHAEHSDKLARRAGYSRETKESNRQSTLHYIALRTLHYIHYVTSSRSKTTFMIWHT